ncbi:hypothetical protein C8R46DRAFT_1229622 [Mycena filopes]|nr:hypothetical protein C8R46DRAFT_1229622 [Mycena filopes]
MREHGAGVITLWLHGDGPLRIDVSSDANYATGRAARSGGRMHGNCVYVDNVPGEFWVLPLRADSAEVHDALYAISQRLPRGVVEADVPPKVVTLVRELVERTREITEII